MRSKNTLFKIVLFIIILLAVIIQPVYAFSPSLRNFINNDKQLKILLYNKINDLNFKPAEKMEIMENKDKGFILEEDEKYRLSVEPGKKTSWRIQVFATGNREKSEMMVKRLKEAGYPEVLVEETPDLYKILVGEFTEKNKAREVEKKLKRDDWNTWVKSYQVDTGEYKINIYDKREEKIYCGSGFQLSGGLYIEESFLPGEFEFQIKDKKLRVYNRTALKNVIIGCLAGEYNNPERKYYQVLKAQAILYRTYLLNLIYTNREGYVHLPSYRGFGDSNLLEKAVSETAGEVLKSGTGSPRTINENTIKGINGLIKENSDYKEILDFFFNGMEILDLTEKYEEKVKVRASVFHGLNYSEIRQVTWWGPRVITVLDLNLDRKGFAVQTYLAGDKIPGLTDLAQTVKAKNALAGINGGYFNYSGRPLGFLMIDNRPVSESLKNRTTLGITSRGEVFIDRVHWEGKVKNLRIDKEITITGVNRQPRRNELVFFNSFFGSRLPPLKNNMQLTVSNNIVKSINGDKNIIPDNGFVIRAHGEAREELENFKTGDYIEYSNMFIPGYWEDSGIRYAIEAGPCLLKNGQINITGQEEEFAGDITGGRAPRTAVGLTADNHLIFVTVDGRQPERSIGMTLEELALFMQKRGVMKALNLDGGGSARMVVRGFTMNTPSTERLISNGIIVKYAGN